MLTISNLEAGYTRIRVLKGVSLQIEAGEIVTLIGANGAGKTALMKTISGLILPSSGSMEFEGKRLNPLPPATRVKLGLVLVPEGRSILKRMTVYENLLMGAYTRPDQDSLPAEIGKIFDRFPVLGERRNLLANVLSGGEQQMLAIGRAMLSRPRLLMLDEPSLGLSPLFVKGIFDIISNLHQSGITIFLVEQNAKKALQVANRGYVMEIGKIVMADKAQNLLHSEALREAYLGGKNEIPLARRIFTRFLDYED
jgi:branched-chain amino acid transport system ATP-binding protein